MLINNLSTYFYMRKSTVEGKTGILHVRVSVNNKVISVNSVKSIRMNHDQFDHKRQRPMPNAEMGLPCAMFINELNKAINIAHIECEQKGTLLSKQRIKRVLTGAEDKTFGIVPAVPTFTFAFDDFLAERKPLIGKLLSMNTYKLKSRYRNFADKVLKSIGLADQPLLNFSSQDVEAFQNQLVKKYAIGTVERSMAVFHNVFDHAVKRGWISVNPCDDVKFVREKDSERDLPVWLTESELLRMAALNLEGTKEEYRDAFLFCAWTGLAVGDYMLINPATREHIINQAQSPKKMVAASLETTPVGTFLKGRRKKTGTEYRVPLGPEALRLIAKYGGLENLPFRTANSGKVLNELMKEIGVKKTIRFHCARKSFANFLLNDKMINPYYAILVMGWKHLEETKPYVRITEETLHRALYGTPQKS